MRIVRILSFHIFLIKNNTVIVIEVGIDILTENHHSFPISMQIIIILYLQSFITSLSYKKYTYQLKQTVL